MNKFLTTSIVIAFIVLCFFLSKNDNYNIINGTTMGTTYEIEYSKSLLSTDQIQEGINNILDDINKQMSTYDNTSEITIFNNMPADSLYKISSDFYYVLEKSKYYYDISEGLFDITVNQLSSVWGFNNTNFIKPSDDLINSTLEIIGFDKIQLLENNTISKMNNEIEINLNAIAKGYALDKISQYFDSNDIGNYMIEIGGEIRVKGNNPDNGKWEIGLSSFELNTGNYIESVLIKNTSMATSGDYRNFRTYNDISYSHIINPVTGYPVDNNIVSATVIADDCIDADALATLLNVIDIDKGIKLINNLDRIECLIIERNEGKFNYYYSKNMEKYIK